MPKSCRGAGACLKIVTNGRGRRRRPATALHNLYACLLFEFRGRAPMTTLIIGRRPAGAKRPEPPARHLPPSDRPLSAHRRPLVWWRPDENYHRHCGDKAPPTVRARVVWRRIIHECAARLAAGVRPRISSESRPAREFPLDGGPVERGGASLIVACHFRPAATRYWPAPNLESISLPPRESESLIGGGRAFCVERLAGRPQRSISCPRHAN
jgi:hypothetical protein